MRILLTAHQFLPDHSTGTEVLTCQVGKELKRLGHEVRVIAALPMKNAPKPDVYFDHYVYQGLEVYRYYHRQGMPVGEQSNIVELEYSNQLFADWLRNFIGAWRPDVVHFFHLKNLSVTAIDMCGDAGIPMVLTPTDFWLVCPTIQLLLPNGCMCNGPDRHGVNCLRHAVANTQSPAISRMVDLIPDALLAMGDRLSHVPPLAEVFPFSWAGALGRRADFFRERVSRIDRMIVPSRVVEKVLEDNRMQARKMVFSRFGIDMTGYRERTFDSNPVAALRIGFIGSLSSAKGAHVLLKAMRLIAAETAIELRVFGNPNAYPDYAKSLAEIAGDDPRIRFCGTFPSESTAAVLMDLDVLVVPSLWRENTPLVVYSAQAASCPVVASDLDGLKEIVRDGMDGMLFPPGNAEVLASIIDRLGKDRNLLHSLAKNAVRPKSISKYTAELITTYDEIVAERKVH